MDKILHDPKDPILWELWYIPYIMGNAGFCPSTVVIEFSVGARMEESQENSASSGV